MSNSWVSSRNVVELGYGYFPVAGITIGITQLVHDDPKAPYVALGIVLLTVDPFGTHVRKCTYKGLAHLFCILEFFGYSEIGDLDFALGIEQDVSWLDISVKLVVHVKIGQPAENLDCYFGEHDFVDFWNHLLGTIDLEYSIERPRIHQLKDDFDGSFLEIGAIQVY